MVLDFRSKLAATIVLSYVLLLGHLQRHFFPLVVFLSALPYLLLLLAKRYATALKGILLVALAALLESFLLHRLSSSIVDSLLLFITMVTLRMAPGVMMGRYSLLTTSMSDLVASLQRMKLPDSLIIPISVMFRFFYTVKEDYRQIQEAMYLQGLTGWRGLRQPFRMLEYRYVPLLMCLSRTADDVAVSAMTRGMKVGEKRSSISKTKLRLPDYALLGLMLAVIILEIWSSYA